MKKLGFSLRNYLVLFINVKTLFEYAGSLSVLYNYSKFSKYADERGQTIPKNTFL